MAQKKIYSPPVAEFALFAPNEKIANWNVGRGSGWWMNNDLLWWGKKGAEVSSLVTGTLEIENEDGNRWTLP